MPLWPAAMLLARLSPECPELRSQGDANRKVSGRLAIRFLPLNTLQSMLSTLPICEKDIACPGIAPVIKSALGLTLKASKDGLNFWYNGCIIIKNIRS